MKSATDSFKMSMNGGHPIQGAEGAAEESAEEEVQVEPERQESLQVRVEKKLKGSSMMLV